MALLGRWHGRRPASPTWSRPASPVTSSPAQLEAAGTLVEGAPDGPPAADPIFPRTSPRSRPGSKTLHPGPPDYPRHLRGNTASSGPGANFRPRHTPDAARALRSWAIPAPGCRNCPDLQSVHRLGPVRTCGAHPRSGEAADPGWGLPPMSAADRRSSMFHNHEGGLRNQPAQEHQAAPGQGLLPGHARQRPPSCASTTRIGNLAPRVYEARLSWCSISARQPLIAQAHGRRSRAIWGALFLQMILADDRSPWRANLPSRAGKAYETPGSDAGSAEEKASGPQGGSGARRSYGPVLECRPPVPYGPTGIRMANPPRLADHSIMRSETEEECQNRKSLAPFRGTGKWDRPLVPPGSTPRNFPRRRFLHLAARRCPRLSRGSRVAQTPTSGIVLMVGYAAGHRYNHVMERQDESPARHSECLRHDISLGTCLVWHHCPGVPARAAEIKLLCGRGSAPGNWDRTDPGL